MNRTIEFTKMQGCGNDYIYINCLDQTLSDPQKLAIRLSNRHFGIGSDGLVLILASQRADLRMQMFNSDGSEGLLCGNALRCVAKYAYERNLCRKPLMTIETASGVKNVTLNIINNEIQHIVVDLGHPIFEAKLIPIYSNVSPLIIEKIEILGRSLEFVCLSMGNPHAVCFVPKVNDELVLKIGPQIENHKLFPKKVNVEFVEVISRTEANMRVWERGSGETLACGSGAAAVSVAGIATDRFDRKVKINMVGGSLDLEWKQSDDKVYMSGGAEVCFEGCVLI